VKASHLVAEVNIHILSKCHLIKLQFGFTHHLAKVQYSFC